MIGSEENNYRPFLPTLAVKRTGSADVIPGRYSSEHDVWIVDGKEGPLPIVTAWQDYSIAPVTKIKGESDEMRGVMLELSTKTSKQVERDDVTPRSPVFLPELSTKTDSVGERDDPSPRFLLELATKTEIAPERDDL
jgi:hypothetical protein